MSEADVISRTGAAPVTVASLMEDLADLGVTPGMTLIVHSSLSKLGWVSGGPVAVILALEQLLGPEGTLVMPTHSGDLTDPAIWEKPPVPESWWQVIRDTMPEFIPDLTPTRGMGRIAETFRHQRGVLRSAHPHYSFAVWGKHAQQIVNGHTLDFGLGNSSPLARVYDLDGHILLLGVGHDSNTSLHLAEYRARYPGRKVILNSAPVLVSGERRWTRMREIDDDTDDFEQIGAAFAAETEWARTGSVALADAILLPQRPLVDFATRLMSHHRP
jgi:aminoglycoside 3-N-acetyltransferase